MMSQAKVSKIPYTLSANQKRVRESMYKNKQFLIGRVYLEQELSITQERCD